MLCINLFDKVASFFLIIAFSPLLITIYVVIGITYRFNPLYRTVRTGKYQKQFTYYKFQTMYPKDHLLVKSSQDIDRITWIGFYLRKYSLDELPSLFCVLLGKMSLVGPRPLPPVYDQLYTPTQLRRFDVKPGITGSAQINGRNSITWRRKFAFDYLYVKNMSFCFNILILIKTVNKVLFAKDVHPIGASKVENFSGKN